MKRKWRSGLAVRLFFAAVAARCVAAPPVAALYEMEDAEISPEAVTCRIVGTENVAADAFAAKDFWTVDNYRNLLGIAHVEGVGLRLTGSDKKCDTAWCAQSARIPLKGGRPRYRLAFRVETKVAIKNSVSGGKKWGGLLRWYGADGAKMSSTPVNYVALNGRAADIAICGGIPAGAVAVSIQLGFDHPNIGPGNSTTYSRLSFEELADTPVFAAKASFVSEMHAGGQVSWRANVPSGCAVRLQWRGAETAEALAGLPFRGPDGTDATFYDSPFTAAAKVMQYRVTLISDGRSTPSLREVSVGGRTDGNWTLDGDVRPPRIRRLSASPTRNAAEPLRIEIKDADSATLWDTLKVVVDGMDRTASLVRDGDVATLASPSVGWAQGLHTADVSVVDFHGNAATGRKMFYIGEAPATPKVTLRDDGIVLIGDKPFFPIGMYAVCKRDFNGKDFDVALKGLKEAGFNLAHTYGNSYDPGFLAAVEKHGFKLWVEARFPDKRLIDVGRHNPSIIAWYLGDDTSDHILPEQEADYDEAVKAVDPTRITVQADPIISSATGKSRYADYVTATDGFMPEIYPVRKKEGDESDRICVAEVIRDMKQFAADARLHGNGSPRTCWPIIQYFKGWSNWAHFPSREQLFAMTFAAVIHGANGLTWYTYGGFGENEGVTSTPERWRNICDLAGQFSELAPILVERTPQQPAAPEVISGPKADHFGAPSVTCLLKRHGEMCYLFSVNSTAEPVAAKLSAPNAKSVEVLREYRSCSCADGTFTDGFAPFAVHIYRWR